MDPYKLVDLSIDEMTETIDTAARVYFYKTLVEGQSVQLTREDYDAYNKDSVHGIAVSFVNDGFKFELIQIPVGDA